MTAHLVVRPVRPDERLLAAAFVREHGLAWADGPSFGAFRGGEPAALARLLAGNPGDGHHREHVREIVACGGDTELPAVVRAAAEAASTSRLEAVALATQQAWLDALRAAGLHDEVRLPEAWREGPGLVDRVLLGRPSPAAPRESRRPAPALAPAPQRGPSCALAIDWADDAAAPALRRFLASLVPGRSYPPGTLLSEAERLETQRRGAGRAPWLLALDDRSEVAGGLVLERDPAPQRAHVRRLHLDVAAPWRGRGVGRELVRAALATCGSRGILRLEADPRCGNAGALGALRSGGMEPAGIQRGAWRLRGPSSSWDEDVAWFSGRT